MTALDRPVLLVVLAGRRADEADHLAQRFAVSHKCLVPLGDRPLIARVLQTAAAHPRIDSLAVSVETEAFAPIYDVLTRLPGRGTSRLVEANADLADSVRAAAEGWDGRILVTTADHALLTAGAIDTLIDALDRADLALALVARRDVLAVHPSAHRRFLRFTDGDYADCNLFAASGTQALGAVELFRGGPSGVWSAWRIMRAFGLGAGFRFAMGLLSLQDALEHASRRLGLKLRAPVLADGRQAIDVDDDRTYAIVSDLLAGRASRSIPR